MDKKSRIENGTDPEKKTLNTSKRVSQEASRQEEILKLAQEPLMDFFMKYSDKEKKYERSRIALENGKLSGFHYDKENDKLKLDILPKEVDGSNDKKKKIVTIDLGKLSQEQRTHLANEVERHLIASEFQLKPENVNNLRNYDGSYYFEDQKGETLKGKLDEKQKKAVEEGMSSLGLSPEDLARKQSTETNLNESVGARLANYETGDIIDNKTNSEKAAEVKGKVTDPEKEQQNQIVREKRWQQCMQLGHYMNLASTLAAQNFEMLTAQMIGANDSPNNNLQQFVSGVIEESIINSSREKLHHLEKGLKQIEDQKKEKKLEK